MACDPGGCSHGLLLPDGLTAVLALDAARGGFASKVEAHVRRVVNRAGHSVLAVFELAAEALTSALGIQQRLTALAKPVDEDRRVPFASGFTWGTLLI